MPFYFAYGSNMNVVAMAARCPRSKPLGAARLMRHQFVIMDAGYASVVRSSGGCVHGLLWDLALSDVAALDRYEGALYSKIIQPVIRAGGGAVQAMIYVGQGRAGGRARPEYAEDVLQAAEAAHLPHGYISGLYACFDVPKPKNIIENNRPKVTPRFATPFDRR
jgi:gamma-glutamylcyclotransferase (GGCT)/AIG2-like uncharacterized protein YtfP